MLSGSTKTPLETENVIVFGMGPAGLLAAYNMAEKGLQVTVVESRPLDKFTRPQRLLLKEDTLKIFIKISTDNLNKIIDSNITSEDSAKRINLFEKDCDFFFTQMNIQIGECGENKDMNKLQKRIKAIEEKKESVKKIFDTLIRRVKNTSSISLISKIEKLMFSTLKGENECSAETKDIQLYLINHIELHKNVILKQPVELDEIEIIERDKTSNTTLIVKLQNSEERKEFNFVIDATGSKHAIASKFGKIDDEYYSEQTRQEAHFTVTFKVKNDESIPLADKYLSHGREALDEFNSLENFSELGWEETALPNFYMIPSYDRKIFYVAGELPNEILHMDDQTKKNEAVQRWAKVILNKAYRFTEDDLGKLEVQINKGVFKPLHITAFPVNLTHVKTPSIEFDNNHGVIMVGDANAQPNFHLGHGVLKATEDANMLVKCFNEDGSFNFNLFNNSFLQNIERIQESMASTKKMRQHELTSLILTLRDRDIKNLVKMQDTIRDFSKKNNISEEVKLYLLDYISTYEILIKDLQAQLGKFSPDKFDHERNKYIISLHYAIMRIYNECKNLVGTENSPALNKGESIPKGGRSLSVSSTAGKLTTQLNIFSSINCLSIKNIRKERKPSEEKSSEPTSEKGSQKPPEV